MNVPEGWERTTLGSTTTVHNGVAPAQVARTSRGAPYLKVDDLNSATKYITTSREYTQDRRWLVPAGSVVFPKRGASILTNKVRLTEVDAVLDTNLMALTNKPGVSNEFLYYAILHAGLSKIADTSTIPQINNKHIRPYALDLPPLPEQRKIAEILRTWDDAIERTISLREHAQTKFSALQRALFAADLDQAHWSSLPLNRLTTRVTRKSDSETHPVMTISAKIGFVRQDEKYSRDMAGANIANYTLLREGEFAYNKGNSLTYPQGCVYPLAEKSALVPNVYFSFKLSADLNAGFYEHLFAAGYLNRQLSRLISSGVRGNGLLNLSSADFFSAHVPVPPRESQDSIARVLDLARTEVKAVDRQLDLLRIQKRGLMQKLLTGEVRVTVEGP